VILTTALVDLGVRGLILQTLLSGSIPFGHVTRLPAQCPCAERHNGKLIIRAQSRVGVLMMANEEHLAILRKGVQDWNQWRERNPGIQPILTGADLRDADLGGVDLKGAELSGANFIRTHLASANLGSAVLNDAILRKAFLVRADLSFAVLIRSDLDRALLLDANLSDSILVGAVLTGTELQGANLTNALL